MFVSNGRAVRTVKGATVRDRGKRNSSYGGVCVCVCVCQERVGRKWLWVLQRDRKRKGATGRVRSEECVKEGEGGGVKKKKIAL